MSLKVATLYQFAALPDFRELREPLRALCGGLGLKGSILLAAEGINGTVVGRDDGIDALVAELQQGALFGGRLDHPEQCAGCDRRVCRGTAGLEHLYSCQRRRRMRGRDHAVLGVHGGPAGEMEIPHTKSLT